MPVGGGHPGVETRRGGELLRECRALAIGLFQISDRRDLRVRFVRERVGPKPEPRVTRLSGGRDGEPARRTARRRENMREDRGHPSAQPRRMPARLIAASSVPARPASDVHATVACRHTQRRERRPEGPESAVRPTAACQHDSAPGSSVAERPNNQPSARLQRATTTQRLVRRSRRTARHARAAVSPVSSAPCTVPACPPRWVCSPAKKSVSATGRARTRVAPSAPTGVTA